jgi:hypothetical protein
MGTARAIHGVAESGEEIALRFALRWHVWRPRTRLRLIRLQLSLQPGRGHGSEAHRPRGLNGRTRPGAGSDSDVGGRVDDGWRNDILSSADIHKRFTED